MTLQNNEMRTGPHLRNVSLQCLMWENRSSTQQNLWNMKEIRVL